jgi:hypothetical protein
MSGGGAEPAKVFISHSAREAPARQALEALRAALQAAGFEVLLDQDRLQPGAEWRPELHHWMSLCHGAVILFSESALASRWVLQEATILNFRRFRDSSFILVPVFVAPVTAAALTHDPFAELALDRIQGVPAGVADEVARQVADRLAPLRDLRGLPTLQARVERLLADCLCGASEPVLRQALHVLGAGPMAWDPSRDLCLLVAGHLLRADFRTAMKALREVAPFLDAAAAGRLLEVLAPAWVDPCAAGKICEIVTRPPGRRAVGVNGRRSFTGITYVRRAGGRYPFWRHVLTAGTGSEDVAGGLIEDVRAGIRRALALAPEDGDEEIEALLEREPLFVLVPPPQPGEEVLARLRQAFPPVTFFLLAGDHATEEDAPPPDVEYLAPRLAPRQEDEAYREYLYTKGLLTAR